MDKLVPVHHSIGDWDFESILSLWLDDIMYISAPTSLACKGVPGFSTWSWLFLKEALGKCIPYGRSITWDWHWKRDDNPTFWYFRTQALPANAQPSNTYRFYHTDVHWTLEKIVADAVGGLADGSLADTITNGTWAHLRLTWYEVFDSDLSSLLRVIFDYEIAGVWVQQFLFDIADPLWSDSEDNKVGFHINGHKNDKPHRIDDTEIWRKSP